ncbi:DNA (cytosine-5-)-methyltransferase [Paracoccaceae bacterium]|nr:DNA (cytosine-5-)-methyltransferase [Paracoccaceae bacterium]
MKIMDDGILLSPEDEITQKRAALGANSEQFAMMLGLRLNPASGDKVLAYEAGRIEPTEAQLKKLAKLPFVPPMRPSPQESKFTFIDLFAGIGGIRIPFQEIGGKCLFTSEWDKDCQITYAANFGEVPNGDITAISSANIPKHDVLLAGFPCQAFSQAGLKQGFYDTRGTMFFEIQKILAKHKPSVVLLENVKQLVGHNKGQTLKTILGTLRGDIKQSLPNNIPMSIEARQSLTEKLNYAAEFRVLSSNNFGVPQKRERVFIIALNKNSFGSITEENIAKIFDDIQNSYKEITRLGDILEPDQLVPVSYTISDKLWNGHLRRREEHKRRGNGFGYSLFNKESKTCNTISQRYYKDGSEVLIDQTHLGKNPRLLTPRECARLQGFPENYCIDAVSKMQNYRQFGNSVSVPVIRAIAQKLKQYLE